MYCYAQAQILVDFINSLTITKGLFIGFLTKNLIFLGLAER